MSNDELPADVREYLADVIEADRDRRSDHLAWLRANPDEPDRNQQIAATEPALHSAAVQDRDGALLVLNRRTRRLFPFIQCILADAAYQGPKVAAAITKIGTLKLTIVQRDELHRLLVLPKHNRRLVRDFERYARSAAAFMRLATIRVMLRSLTHQLFAPES